MSFDSLYNSNPNLKLKILQELVDEYKGYIAGTKVQNELGIFGSSEVQSAQNMLKTSGLTDSILGKTESNIEKVQKSVVNKYMYSSGGCYQIHDLLGNLSVFDNVPKDASKTDKEAAGQTIDDAVVVLFEPDQQLSQYSMIVLKEQDATDASSDYEYSLKQAVPYDAMEALKHDTDDEYLKVVEEKRESHLRDENAKFGSMKKMLANYRFEDSVIDKRKFQAMKKGTYNEIKQADALFNDYLKNIQAEELIEKARLQAQGVEEEEEEQEKTKDERLNEFMDNVLPIAAPNKKLISVKKDFINNAIKTPTTTKPSMSAVVVKKPSMSLNSRNDNFLSVFFGAVSQLELSRCTPYLTLTFFNDSGTGKNEPYRDYLDNAAYMRFSGGKDGVFSTGDGLGISQAMPTFSQAEISKDKIGPVGHMDIFTSPQTMVNAKINQQAQTFDSLANIGNSQDTHIKNLDNVLDPFAPMMSLKSFNITVQGGQYYLVTNRRANMSVTLHDRSRLADISPFISLNEVARTIVRVEHGWSHPEGDIIRSKNPIGRFLNCMRETCYYQLTSSDFTFNGNSVNINMTLDFFGFTDFVDANVSLGEKRPLSSSSLQKKIARAFDDITDNQSFKVTKIKPPEKKEEKTKEQQKVEKEQQKKQGRVIKTLKILRTHAQNTQLAVDTEKAQNLEKFIDETLTKVKGKDKKFPVKDAIVHEFLERLFDLLELTNLDNLPFDGAPGVKDEKPSINKIKEVFGKEGFTESINEFLRFNYAKETINKLESLLGYDYNVSDPETVEVQKKLDHSTDPPATEKEIKNDKKQEAEAAEGAEKQVTEPKPDPKDTETIVNISPAVDQYGHIIKKNLTPDYFLSHRCFKYGAKPTRINKITNKVKYTSLGKLICGMVALPAVAAASTYSEVQVFFYPINNQAAGARKYTTASLPVNNQELLQHVEKAIESNYPLTLKDFFELLSNMFENNNLDVYGISSVDSAIEDINKRVDEALKEDKEKGHETAYSHYVNKLGRQPQTQAEKEIAFNDYKKHLEKLYGSNNKKTLKSALTKIYSEDGLGFAPTDRFVKPILQMEIESVPAIIPRKSKAVSSDSLLDLYAKEFSYNFLSPDEKDINALTGVDNSKRILRIHIYDSNSAQKPFEKIAMESAIDFDKFLPFVGQLKETYSKDMNGDGFINHKEQELHNTLRQVQGDLTKAFRKMSPNELKQYMIRSFPTIKYGSQTAVVKQISVRSNTTDSIINARLMNEIKAELDKKKANLEKGNQVREDYTTFVIPTSVDITLYGCPFITVGNCIYLDLGTGTDIDNVYMVTDVTHSIGPGEYSTQITVAMPAQGTVKSTQDRIVTMVNAIGDVEENPV